MLPLQCKINILWSFIMEMHACFHVKIAVACKPKLTTENLVTPTNFGRWCSSKIFASEYLKRISDNGSTRSSKVLGYTCLRSRIRINLKIINL